MASKTETMDDGMDSMLKMPPRKGPPASPTRGDEPEEEPAQAQAEEIMTQLEDQPDVKARLLELLQEEAKAAEEPTDEPDEFEELAGE